MSLQLGDIAPDFTADSTEGEIRFHEYLGDIPIYVGKNDSEDFETHYIKDLLPYPFG